MNDGLPWLRMSLMLAMLVAMFVLPFLAVKVLDRRERRRSADPGGTSRG